MRVTKPASTSPVTCRVAMPTSMWAPRARAPIEIGPPSIRTRNSAYDGWVRVTPAALAWRLNKDRLLVRRTTWASVRLIESSDSSFGEEVTASPFLQRPFRMGVCNVDTSPAMVRCDGCR